MFASLQRFGICVNTNGSSGQTYESQLSPITPPGASEDEADAPAVMFNECQVRGVGVTADKAAATACECQMLVACDHASELAGR